MLAAMHILTSLALIVTLAPSQGPQRPPERERARAQSRIGWDSMRVERYAEAAGEFRKAIDIDATYEYAYYGLGRAQLALKQYVEAIATLEKTAGLYRAQASRQFTNAQDAQRYRRDRITEIDEQIRQLQTGPQTLQTQDLIRQFQNLRRETQDRIDRGNNMNVEVYVPAFVSLSLGSAYFRSGRLEEAERAYKATVEADPKSGEAFNNLAVVYLQRERFAEAQQAIDAAKRAGYRVNPELEQQIKKRRRQG